MCHITVQVYYPTLMLVSGGDAAFVGDQNGVLLTGPLDNSSCVCGGQNRYFKPKAVMFSYP